MNKCYQSSYKRKLKNHKSRLTAIKVRQKQTIFQKACTSVRTNAPALLFWFIPHQKKVFSNCSSSESFECTRSTKVNRHMHGCAFSNNWNRVWKPFFHRFPPHTPTPDYSSVYIPPCLCSIQMFLSFQRAFCD